MHPNDQSVHNTAETAIAVIQKILREKEFKREFSRNQSAYTEQQYSRADGRVVTFLFHHGNGSRYTPGKAFLELYINKDKICSTEMEWLNVEYRNRGDAYYSSAGVELHRRMVNQAVEAIKNIT